MDTGPWLWATSDDQADHVQLSGGSTHSSFTGYSTRLIGRETLGLFLFLLIVIGGVTR